MSLLKSSRHPCALFSPLLPSSAALPRLAAHSGLCNVAANMCWVCSSNSPTSCPFTVKACTRFWKISCNSDLTGLACHRSFICLKILEEHGKLLSMALNLTYQGQLARLVLPPVHHHSTHHSWHLKTRSHDMSNSSVRFLCCLETKFVSPDCWHCFCNWTSRSLGPEENSSLAAAQHSRAMGLHPALQSKAAGMVLTCLWWDTTFVAASGVTAVFLHSSSLVFNYCMP